MFQRLPAQAAMPLGLFTEGGVEGGGTAFWPNKKGFPPSQINLPGNPWCPIHVTLIIISRNNLLHHSSKKRGNGRLPRRNSCGIAPRNDAYLYIYVEAIATGNNMTNLHIYTRYMNKSIEDRTPLNRHALSCFPINALFMRTFTGRQKQASLQLRPGPGSSFPGGAPYPGAGRGTGCGAGISCRPAHPPRSPGCDRAETGCAR